VLNRIATEHIKESKSKQWCPFVALSILINPVFPITHLSIIESKL
jgi:hypothetical protein